MSYHFTLTQSRFKGSTPIKPAHSKPVIKSVPQTHENGTFCICYLTSWPFSSPYLAAAAHESWGSVPDQKYKMVFPNQKKHLMFPLQENSSSKRCRKNLLSLQTLQLHIILCPSYTIYYFTGFYHYKVLPNIFLFFKLLERFSRNVPL